MAITMAKNNKLLVKCFLNNNSRTAIETVRQKISYNELKNKSFELIEYFKQKGIKKVWHQ